MSAGSSSHFYLVFFFFCAFGPNSKARPMSIWEPGFFEHLTVLGRFLSGTFEDGSPSDAPKRTLPKTVRCSRNPASRIGTCILEYLTVVIEWYCSTLNQADLDCSIAGASNVKKNVSPHKKGTKERRWVSKEVCRESRTRTPLLSITIAVLRTGSKAIGNSQVEHH